MDGHNIADFYDADIEERLNKLEEEEADIEAQLAALEDDQVKAMVPPRCVCAPLAL